jgi:hypothetical protein
MRRIMITQAAPFSVAAIHPALGQYFENFNSGNYDAVASLFDAEGVLRPPFEEGILGPEAIRSYLATEAKGMKATPLEAETMDLEDGCCRIVVKGRVKALVFLVNLQWTFTLNSADKIQDAHIKLLASLQELMKINQGDKPQDYD